jgi:hypothetical protein
LITASLISFSVSSFVGVFMDEKRATIILLLIFGAVFVYSVVMRDRATDPGLAFQGHLAREGQVVSFETAVGLQKQQLLAAFASGTTAPGPFASMGRTQTSPSSLTGAAVRPVPAPQTHNKLLLAAFDQGKPTGASTSFYSYLLSQGGKKK